MRMGQANLEKSTRMLAPIDTIAITATSVAMATNSRAIDFRPARRGKLSDTFCLERMERRKETGSFALNMASRL
jgi:hypothetical protein